jgi:SAM-dependent methyltransferase
VDSKRWNARYAAKQWEPERPPNLFMVRELAGRTAGGRALDLACGEGRNAVWLAAQGWRVTAVDFSGVALDRAQQLAARRGVEVDWVRADVTRFSPRPGSYALVALLYLQLPGAERRRVLEHAAAAMADGGELFMVGHALRNLREGTGGPSDPAVLWQADEIRSELTALDLAVERAETERRPVAEPAGSRDAFDVLAQAHRPAAG